MTFKKRINIYVDGSYKPKYEDKVGSGLVVVKNDDIVDEVSFSVEDKELSKLRNVGGELRASMKAMLYAYENGYEIVNIHYDYEGIEKWTDGSWKCKNKYTQMYKQFYDDMKTHLTIKFTYVKAHDNNEYNELADKLAKQSLEIENNK